MGEGGGGYTNRGVNYTCLANRLDHLKVTIIAIIIIINNKFIIFSLFLLLCICTCNLFTTTCFG